MTLLEVLAVCGAINVETRGRSFLLPIEFVPRRDIRATALPYLPRLMETRMWPLGRYQVRWPMLAKWNGTTSNKVMRTAMRGSPTSGTSDRRSGGCGDREVERLPEDEEVGSEDGTTRVATLWKRRLILASVSDE